MSTVQYSIIVVLPLIGHYFRTIGICTANCRYESVRRVSKRYGFKEVGENEDWVLFWTDCSVNIERVMDMKRYQVSLFILPFLELWLRGKCGGKRFLCYPRKVRKGKK